MSALLVDDLVAAVPTRTRPGRWRHVERGPQLRPKLVALPGGRPLGVEAPPVRVSVRPAPPATAPGSAGWQLTDRGLLVVVVFFLALVTTAAVVLVGAFLSVSNAPVEVPGTVLAGAMTVG